MNADHRRISSSSSQAPITVLHELSAQRPDLMRNPSFEVYIDSGVTRGTDVLKALCLGARAVGLGRAFLYANGIWGQQGCERVIQSEWYSDRKTSPQQSTRIDTLRSHARGNRDRHETVGGDEHRGAESNIVKVDGS